MNHIRIVIENGFFVHDTQFNHSTAPNDALRSDSFPVLFNGYFNIKLCIKHWKPFSVPVAKHSRQKKVYFSHAIVAYLSQS